MKKLTVKDFILYNSPCFNCQNKILFRFATAKTEIDIKNFTESGVFTPNFNNNTIELDLIIKYSKFLKLKIDAKTNKFWTDDPAGLTNFLSEYKLFLESFCTNCYTKIRSAPLKFSFNYGFIFPTETIVEYLKVKDQDRVYTIYSVNETTEITVREQDHQPRLLSIPIVRFSKFQTKQNLLNKVKLYFIFS